jgi:DNA-binding transcriptional LysR family regulator
MLLLTEWLFDGNVPNGVSTPAAQANAPLHLPPGFCLSYICDANGNIASSARKNETGMDWDDIKLFLALMRGGNVRVAAAKLGVSHSTVARRVDAMEERLATRLFERLPTGYVLTSVGEDMLAVAEQVEDELEGLERRIEGRDNRLSGRIRVTMVDALATHLLMPHLAEFSQIYPEIDIEVPVAYETADLDRREADVALRFAQNPPGHLIGRKLVTCATAAYGSKRYLLNRHLQSPEDARWIGFGPGGPYPKWVKQSSYPAIPARGEFISLLVQLSACKAGMGLAMLPCFLGDGEASLRRLSSPKADPSFDLWILTHRDMRASARIRVFCEFISKAITSHRSLLEGRESKKPQRPR